MEILQAHSVHVASCGTFFGIGPHVGIVSPRSVPRPSCRVSVPACMLRSISLSLEVSRHSQYGTDVKSFDGDRSPVSVYLGAYGTYGAYHICTEAQGKPVNRVGFHPDKLREVDLSCQMFGTLRRAIALYVLRTGRSHAHAIVRWYGECPQNT